MNEKEESSFAAEEYLTNLVRIADKYEIERNKFVKICIMALVMTANSINFDKYYSEKGE